MNAAVCQGRTVAFIFRVSVKVLALRAHLHTRLPLARMFSLGGGVGGGRRSHIPAAITTARFDAKSIPNKHFYNKGFNGWSLMLS